MYLLNSETPLYNHPLPQIEQWLENRGCQQDSKLLHLWRIQKPAWEAEIWLDVEEITVRYINAGEKQEDVQRSFKYSLSRQDVEEAIFCGIGEDREIGGWGDGESTLVGRLPQYERSGVSVASPKEIPEGGDGEMGRELQIQNPKSKIQNPMPNPQCRIFKLFQTFCLFVDKLIMLCGIRCGRNRATMYR